MVSLVTHFAINIPDLACLMMVPEILCVIQEKLLHDRRLLVDYDMKPKVVLRNKLMKYYAQECFDQFELANKFKSFSKMAQDLKLFNLHYEMEFKKIQRSQIAFNFLLAAENIQFDKSTLYCQYEKVDETDINLDIIELTLKKSVSLNIDYGTYNIIPQSRRIVHINIKELIIQDPDSFNCPIPQLFMQFPSLETLKIQGLPSKDKNFVKKLQVYFKSAKHLKSFNAQFDYCCEQKQLRKKLIDLFKEVIDIEVPFIQLKFGTIFCKAGFLHPDIDSEFYQIFPSQCDAILDYTDFDDQEQEIDYKNVNCKMNLTFKQYNSVQEGDCKYNFDLTYKKR
eukprot:403346699